MKLKMVWLYVFLILLWKFIASYLECACLATPQDQFSLQWTCKLLLGVIGCPNSCLTRRRGEKKKSSSLSCFQVETICEKPAGVVFPIANQGIETQPSRAPRQLLLPQMVNKH